MTAMILDLQDDVVGALRESAELRRAPIGQVAAELIFDIVRGEDRLVDQFPWTAEGLAAIDEGLDQLDRGEFDAHEEVMASIEARLRA